MERTAAGVSILPRSRSVLSLTHALALVARMIISDKAGRRHRSGVVVFVAWQCFLWCDLPRHRNCDGFNGAREIMLVSFFSEGRRLSSGNPPF